MRTWARVLKESPGLMKLSMSVFQKILESFSCWTKGAQTASQQLLSTTKHDWIVWEGSDVSLPQGYLYSLWLQWIQLPQTGSAHSLVMNIFRTNLLSKLPMLILFPAYNSLLKWQLCRIFLDCIIPAGGRSRLVFLWVGYGSWRRL